MTRVVINEAGLEALVRGPITGYVRLRSEGVSTRAKMKAHVRSGELQEDIRILEEQELPDGAAMAVGTTVHSPRQNFNYGYALETGKHPQTGEQIQEPYPFLEPALREEFGR